MSIINVKLNLDTQRILDKAAREFAREGVDKNAGQEALDNLMLASFRFAYVMAGKSNAAIVKDILTKVAGNALLYHSHQPEPEVSKPN